MSVFDTFIFVSKQLDIWQIFKPVINFENNKAKVKSLFVGQRDIKVDFLIWTVVVVCCLVSLESVDKISLDILGR